MTATPITPFATWKTEIAVGGRAVTVMYGPLSGGLILNPATAADQGIGVVEVLYVSLVGSAETTASGTTTAIQPGQLFFIPAGQTGDVSVNAATSGHRFSAIVYQPQSPVTPVVPAGSINPCLQELIPSYLYQQYADDDDLQAFVSAYNEIAQAYLTWMNDIGLPVYTGPMIVGDLLDWVALGLYGVRRPIFSSGVLQIIGPFNTVAGNTRTFNGSQIISSPVFEYVTDDIFKRILTWKLYKGDGKVIDIRWLKRRVMRFLTGDNGTDPNVADTQQISVTFSNDTQITLTTITEGPGPTFTIEEHVHPGEVIIGLLRRVTQFTGGAFYNTFAGNSMAFNGSSVSILTYPSLPNAEIFKEAIEQGVLDMPFQFKTTVDIRQL